MGVAAATSPTHTFVIRTVVTANLFRRNLFASGFVPDFQKVSEFVPDGQRTMIL